MKGIALEFGVPYEIKFSLYPLSLGLEGNLKLENPDYTVEI